MARTLEGPRRIGLCEIGSLGDSGRLRRCVSLDEEATGHLRMEDEVLMVITWTKPSLPGKVSMTLAMGQ